MEKEQSSEKVLQKLDEQYQKYKFMEVNLIQKKNRYRSFCKAVPCFLKIILSFYHLHTQSGITCSKLTVGTRCEICTKLTIKTPERRLALFWCLCCQLWAYFTPWLSVSIVNIEQVSAGWVASWNVQMSNKINRRICKSLSDVDKKYTRKTSLASFLCFSCSINGFEHIFVF